MLYLDARASHEHTLQVSGELKGYSHKRGSHTHEEVHDWTALRAIDFVQVMDDPFIWKGLMARSLRGDRRAYHELLTQFGEVLFQFFSRLLHEEAVEPAVQETLKAVHHNRATCDAKGSVLNWLIALALREVRLRSEM